MIPDTYLSTYNQPLSYSPSLFLPRSSRVCSDRGNCVCGKCECKTQTDRQYQGKFCECDNISCPKVNGLFCNGFQHECNCGKCICDAGWTGADCTCTTLTDNCKNHELDNNINASLNGQQAPGPENICNSNGICECGDCKCAKTDLYEFKGKFCGDLSSNCRLHANCVHCV